MTQEPTDRNTGDDGRHDFHAATLTAGDDQFVDDREHEFIRGRVADRDENEQA